MADKAFNSTFAIDAEAGFDAGRLQGKSVVVTGGASGLGEEMVRQFVKAGAFVTIGDLSEERSAVIVNELGNDSCTFAQTDVLSWSSQLALFKHAIASSPTKRVDVVIANAGISGHDNVWRPDTDAAEPEEPNLDTLKINLVGVHYTAKLASHYLPLSPTRSPTNPGALIMTASLAGYLDMPSAPQYGASKWGVRGMMHSLRRTYPALNCRVNIICPWFVKTPILNPSTTDLLASRGVPFAEAADAGKAALLFAADDRVNGRMLAVLPRDQTEGGTGLRDLGVDDFNEGEVLTQLQRRLIGGFHGGNESQQSGEGGGDGQEKKNGGP